MVFVKYVLIILIALIVIWPVYWLVQGSFQDHWGVFSIPHTFFPTGLHLRNYKAILSGGYNLKWLSNTLIVVSVQSTLVLLMCASAGMAFALYEFPGKKIVFWAFFSTVMIPGKSILIGKFIVMRALGLGGTIWAAIIPVMFYAMGILLFRTFVEELPPEIVDQARIDGAGETRILTKIIMPLTVPVSGVVVLFTSLGALSNYLWQAIVLQKMELKTLLVGMIVRMNSNRLTWEPLLDPLGMRMAAGCIILIPSLLIFIFCNKLFIREMRLGVLIK